MSAHDDRGYDELTEREREVITVMARGLTNGQIAERLGIAFETAKWHVAHIIAKTGAATREEAVANWRTWSRPGSRAKRWVRGAMRAPRALQAGVAVGLVATGGLVALAVAGLWQPENQVPPPDPLQDSAPTSYLVMVGGDLVDRSVLPFAEAIRMSQVRTGHAAPVPRHLPPALELRPLIVSVLLPPESFSDRGLAHWSVGYGDGPTQETSNLTLLLTRTGVVGSEGAREWDVVGRPDVFELLDGKFVARVVHLQSETIYEAAGRDSSLMTQMSVRPANGISRDEALAILESVLAQE